MKKILLIGAGVFVLLAWLSLGLALTIDISRETLFIWVTAVALTPFGDLIASLTWEHRLVRVPLEE